MPPGASQVRLLRAVHDDPLFRATRSPYLVVDRALRIRAANPAHLSATLREPGDVLGRHLFDAFPDDPDRPGADGVARLTSSLVRVLRSGARDEMGLQRYDVPAPGGAPGYVEKVWVVVNSPVHDADERLAGVLVHAEDVTDLWSRLRRAVGPAADGSPGGDPCADPDGDPDDDTGGDPGGGAPGAGHDPRPAVPPPAGGPDDGPELVRRWARARPLAGPSGDDGPGGPDPLPGRTDPVGAAALARELAAQNARLRRRFRRHVAIEQAKGVLMAVHGCGPDDAFARLRERSQTGNTKLWQVAREVVDRALGDGPH